MNFLIIIIFILLGLLLAKFLQRYPVPYASVLLILGFSGSEFLILLGFDTGLRWDNFNLIVSYIILPILIFEMALSLSAEGFFRKLGPILVLALPMMLASTVIISILLFFGINHPGFPLIAAVITAALLATSDPISINSLTRNTSSGKDLTSLLKGESLFNSLIIIVLLTITIELIRFDHSLQSIALFEVYILFIKLFSGGIFTGLVCGFIGISIISDSKLKGMNAVVSLFTASVTFLVAELLAVSGILAVLVAGLMFNATMQKKSSITQLFIGHFWEQSAFVARTILYLMLGGTIYLPFLQDQWLAILIGLAAVLFSRAVLIFIVFSLIGKYVRSFYLPTNKQFLLFLGSIKGAIVIALVFSLPDNLPYIQTIQAIVYGMLIFSLLIQAPILKYILSKKLN